MNALFIIGIIFVIFGLLNLNASHRIRKKGETVWAEKNNHIFRVHVVKGKKAKEMGRKMHSTSVIFILAGVIISILAIIAQ